MYRRFAGAGKRILPVLKKRRNNEDKFFPSKPEDKNLRFFAFRDRAVDVQVCKNTVIPA
jgi:hypothetical protein